MVRVAGQGSKIAGGFVLIEIPALMAAWRACRSRPLGSGDFRAWLACHELAARRCLIGKGRAPSYSAGELARLVGVSSKTARASVGRLVAAGLVEVGIDRIGFPGQPLEVEELVDTLGRGRGCLAIPRRMLRFLAAGARPAMIATVLGTLLRCLSRRRSGFDGRGRVKSSWIARAFDVDVRRVKAARAELVDLGWIEPEQGGQRIENRYGRAFRIDLGWAWSPGTGLPPPEPVERAEIATPSVDPEPLRESENQEPAAAEPESTGVQVQDSGEIPAPKLDDVRPEDLRETGRLLDLFGQAAGRGLVGSSEADRLRFVGLAEHARSVGKSNPPGLFAALLRRRAWSFITQGEEDSARLRLRAHLWPAPSATTSIFHGPALKAPAPSLRSMPVEKRLSDDARIVREVSRALAAAGYRGDPFPHMRRLNAGWTRDRWDRAVGEV